MTRIVGGFGVRISQVWKEGLQSFSKHDLPCAVGAAGALDIGFYRVLSIRHTLSEFERVEVVPWLSSSKAGMFVLGDLSTILQ